MRLKVRPMTVYDKPVIIQTLKDIAEFTPDEVTVAEEVIDSYLRDSTSSGYHVFVAEIGSSIAGYICYGPTPLTEGTWDIYWLAVAPKQQSQGIGKALLAFAEDRIQQTRSRMILIETSSKPEYAATRRFYRAQDYKLACRIADFYTTNDDKLIFQKRLR